MSTAAGIPQAVTHPSTNQPRHCLTSVIRRELVLLIQLIWFLFKSTIISWADSNPMENVYSNWYSQAVTHPSTNQPRHCLTSVIRRELVL